MRRTYTLFRITKNLGILMAKSSRGHDFNVLRGILEKCIGSVDPAHLIQTVVQKQNLDVLKIRDISLTANENCFVIGFGKATYRMAVELEKILDHHLQGGIISIPEGSLAIQNSRLKPDSKVGVFQGARNNLPDENAFVAAKNIKLLAEKCSADDILFVLISGGGSALLPYPKPPITLSEKYETVKLLASTGADITQLNTVRKALSELKSGKLAALAYPANTIALIVSDVVGDPLRVIASGPTVISNEDGNERENAVKILNEFRLFSVVPESVRRVLRTDDEVGSHKPEPGPWLHNFIIGNNATALTTAELEAERLGYVPIVISSRITGSVSRVAAMYSELTVLILTMYSRSNLHFHGENYTTYMDKLRTFDRSVGGIEDVIASVSNCVDAVEKCRREGRKLLLICGGEPTVEVKGNGMGGRNQELALEVAIQLDYLKKKKEALLSEFDVLFMSAGTDGIDGPTDAAGAVSYTDIVKHALDECRLNAKSYLQDNDSYSFFSKFRNGSCHIKMGHTGTNVMDVHFLLICAK